MECSNFESHFFHDIIIIDMDNVLALLDHVKMFYNGFLLTHNTDLHIIQSS